ncbi:hypothetical protein GF354_03620 [Candidatus Peregrinibacteria bacterium]|nr:hypothetical protein [Candidatus Peregrinibacteria bacterium]
MKKKNIKISISALLIIVAICILTIFSLCFVLHGRISPGTYVAGIDISNLTPDKAVEKLEDKVSEFSGNGLEISFKKNHVFSPRDLGITLLSQETVDSISTVNSDHLLSSTFEILFENNNERNILFLADIERHQLIKNIEKTFGLGEIKPVNAQFTLDEYGKLSILNGAKGYIIDEEKLLSDIESSVGKLDSTPIILDLVEKDPMITTEDLVNEESYIRELISHSITVEDPIYSDPWYVKIADYPEWVEFISTKNGTEIKIKQEELDKFIDEEISKWLDLEPENVNIYMDENNEVIIEGRGNDGKRIQRELLKESLEIAVKDKVDSVVVPVKKVEPQITISEDLQELGIKERIGVGHTSFYGSPSNRVHNIKVGASKFQGKIVAPGEVFSFNENLGRVDGTTGYRRELVIKPDGTKPEWGGGICQVSTTMYRAILFSGLEIVKRFPHSYAVSYYSQVLGHGLDATIYLGGPDLQFKNNTDNHILIQAYTQDDYELYFVFYGTSDGKSVEMEGPYLSGYHSPGATQYIETTTLAPGQTKQVEKRHTGFTAIWYRYITDSAGKTVKERITTKYKAIPARILVGVESVSE